MLDPESNVQFGEGGAGTFSDGKLWSQISDPRHLTRKVLTEFVKAGAPEEILFVAKPHIGTFRLVGMVEKMRADIEALGGEIRFRQQVVDLLIEDGPGGKHVRGLMLASGEQLRADHVVLALGHSARDTFAMLQQRGVALEAKPFSIGFRIEHPQGLIDRARFGPNAGHPILGAADYKLVHHASNGRSVYSFCMCPGGTVVAATSEEGRVVTNGMSQYSRNERNANAGIVVGISPQDYRQTAGRRPGGPARRRRLPALLGEPRVRARRRRLPGARAAAGRLRQAPALQRLRQRAAFVQARRARSPTWPNPAAAACPTTRSTPSARRCPPSSARSRASRCPTRCSPASRHAPRRRCASRAGRDHQSINVAGLYPAGEGAGYAGGIMSAGVDGIEVAEALGAKLLASLKAA